MLFRSRYAALQSLGKGDDKLFAQVAAGMPRYDAAAQAAVIGWLGECGAVSQADVITAAVASPDDREQILLHGEVVVLDGHRRHREIMNIQIAD